MKSPATLLTNITRYALLVAIAVILGLIISTPRNEYPLTMTKAQAEGISAATGYLMTSLSVGASDRFYLVETTKQVICSYSVTNGQLRLESARKFDNDTTIVEGSQPVQVNGKALKLEGGNGLTRDEAGLFGKEVLRLLEEGKRINK